VRTRKRFTSSKGYGEFGSIVGCTSSTPRGGSFWNSLNPIKFSTNHEAKLNAFSPASSTMRNQIATPRPRGSMVRRLFYDR
jgi:hypothetical protein